MAAVMAVDTSSWSMDQWKTWFFDFVRSRGLAGTSANLASIEKELKAWGVIVIYNAAKMAGKIKLPDGTVVDVIYASHEGGKGWQWLVGKTRGGHAMFDPWVLNP